MSKMNRGLVAYNKVFRVIERLFVPIVAVWFLLTIAGDVRDAVTANPFKPIRANEIVVSTKETTPGGSILVNDGICNLTKENHNLLLHVSIQEVRIVGGVTTIGRSYDIYGTDQVPETYGLNPHECIATQPTPITIPLDASPSEYKLTVVAVVRGVNTQRQEETRNSNIFVVKVHD